MGRDQPRARRGVRQGEVCASQRVFSKQHLKPDEQVVHFLASDLARRAGHCVELSCTIPGHFSSTCFFRDSLIFHVSGVEIPLISHLLVAAEPGELCTEFPFLVEASLGLSRGTVTLPEPW